MQPPSPEYINLYAMLKNVLVALAQLIPKAGYVQGMNHIVCAIAYHLQEPFYKDLSPSNRLVSRELFLFWIMVYVMQELNWVYIFTQHFIKLKKLAEAFEQKLLDSDKEVIDHIYYYGINDGYNTKNMDFGLLEIFLSSFLTVMTDVLPLNLTASVIDIFLLTGEKVVMDVIGRAIYFNRDKILQMKEKEVSQLLM
jgi:hypothetical protein